jgi:hypothetical protein
MSLGERILKVIITGDSRKAVDAFKETAKAAGETAQKSAEHSASIGKAFKSIGAVALPVVGVAIAIGGAAIEMSDKWELAHAKLTTALTNTGTSFKAVSKQVDALDKSGVNLGFTTTDTEATLAQMTTGLGDVHKAMGAFTVVQNLAAAKGISLQDAGLAVTKAMEGQLRPLKQLGIDLPFAAGGAVKVQKAYLAVVGASANLSKVQAEIANGTLKGTKAHDQLAAAQDKLRVAQTKLTVVQQTGGNILAALSQKLKGQAAAAAETFAGKQAVLKARLNEVGVEIGTRLTPFIIKAADILVNDIIPAIDTAVGWIENHFIPGVQNLVRTIQDWIDHNKVLTVVLLAILEPIPTLVAGIILLWTHFERFRDVVKSVFNGIKDTIVANFHFIEGLFKIFDGLIHGDWSQVWDGLKESFKAFWEGLKGIAEIGGKLLQAALSIEWELIQAAVKAAWNGITSVIGSAASTIAGFAGAFLSAGAALGSAILHGIESGLTAIGGFVSDIGSAVWQAVKDAVNSVIDLINNAIPDSLGFGPFSISLPANPIPRLAQGGIVKATPGGVLALLGEGGRDEAVVPLNSRGGPAAGGGNHYTINVTALDPNDAAELVVRALRSYEMRNGPIPVTTR